MNILFYIENLEMGGAEAQIVAMAKGMLGRGHQVTVVCNYPGGKYWDAAKSVSGLNVFSLFNLRSSYKINRILHRALAPMLLAKRIKTQKTNVIYSCLYLSNLTALLATFLAVLPPDKLLDRPFIIWSLRITEQLFKGSEKIWFNLCKRLSAHINLLSSNSYSGLLHHQQIGFKAVATIVLPNIIDHDHFVPAIDSHHTEQGTIQIAVIGRIHRQKNIQMAIHAYAEAAKQLTLKPLIIAGPVRDKDYHIELITLIDKLGITDKVEWLPQVNDVRSLYQSIDLLLNSSVSEGFSNVIAEAMCCNVRCIVTNVGDSAKIVGNSGIVVELQDSQKMADAIVSLVNQMADLPVSPREQMMKICNSEMTLQALEDKINAIQNGNESIASH